MHRFLVDRELGRASSLQVRVAERTRRTFALDLARARIVSQHRQAIVAVDIDAAIGKFLLAGSLDGGISIYDLGDGADAEQAASIEAVAVVAKGTPRGHGSGIARVQWYRWDPGMFLSGSADKSIRVWDTNALKTVAKFKFDSQVFSLAMSPMPASANLVAAACGEPNVRLGDLRIGAFTHSLAGHQGKVLAVEWSPLDPNLLATGGVDKTVRLWDVRRASGACLHSFNQYNTASGGRSFESRTSTTATAHNDTVNGLCFSPDGFSLLSTGRDQRMRLWDVLQGTNTLVNFGSVHNVSARAVFLAVAPDADPTLVFHPHGNRRSLTAYSLVDGESVTELVGHYDVPICTAFHPFQQWLVSGGSEGQILLWTPAVDDSLILANLGDNVVERARLDAWSDDDD